MAQRPALVEGDRVPIADRHYAVEGIGQMGPSITRSSAFHSTHRAQTDVAVQIESGSRRDRTLSQDVRVPPAAKWCRR